MLPDNGRFKYPYPLPANINSSPLDDGPNRPRLEEISVFKVAGDDGSNGLSP